MEQLINDDWSYISSVIECCDELVDIQESLQDQNLPSENWLSITVTEGRLNQRIQMTAQMQQALIGQQQIQQQQKLNMNLPSLQVIRLDFQNWKFPLCVRLFLVLPWVCLWFVIVVFTDHVHFLF